MIFNFVKMHFDSFYKVVEWIVVCENSCLEEKSNQSGKANFLLVSNEFTSENMSDGRDLTNDENSPVKWCLFFLKQVDNKQSQVCLIYDVFLKKEFTPLLLLVFSSY